MFSKVKDFLTTLYYFLELYNGGFRIHRSNPVMKCNFYRFYWHDKCIKDMPDIDYVKTMSGTDFWNTLRDGHVERLSPPLTRTNFDKQNSFY